MNSFGKSVSLSPQPIQLPPSLQRIKERKEEVECAKLGVSQESQWLEHILGLEQARQYLTYYSALIRLHLEYLVQSWWSQYSSRKNVKWRKSRRKQPKRMMHLKLCQWKIVQRTEDVLSGKTFQGRIAQLSTNSQTAIKQEKEWDSFSVTPGSSAIAWTF